MARNVLACASLTIEIGRDASGATGKLATRRGFDSGVRIGETRTFLFGLHPPKLQRRGYRNSWKAGWASLKDLRWLMARDRGKRSNNAARRPCQVEAPVR